jgi:hypothetical protein
MKIYAKEHKRTMQEGNRKCNHSFANFTIFLISSSVIDSFNSFEIPSFIQKNTFLFSSHSSISSKEFVALNFTKPEQNIIKTNIIIHVEI